MRYTMHDYQHFICLWYLRFKEKCEATLMKEAAVSSETLINLYLSVEWCHRRQFLQVKSSHCKSVSLKIVTLKFHCVMLQADLTAVMADRYRLER